MNLYTKSPTNSFMEESDEALCALVAGGDRLAEEVLITRYHRLVRAITRPYFLAGGDSDDLNKEYSCFAVAADYTAEESPF